MSEQNAEQEWLPPEEEPWALSLVVRVERESAGGPPAHTDVLVAAARAVVALLIDERTTDPDGVFHDAVARWRGQRIRKIGRRARGSRWDRTAELPHVEARAGGDGQTPPAQVRAFAPHPRDDSPKLLRDLQVGGLDLTDPDPSPRDHGRPPPSVVADAHDHGRGGPVLTIRLAPGVTMSTGKAVAQVGHAAQLALERLDRATVSAWLASADPDVATALAVVVLQGAPVLPASQRVDIRDAGYTEVAPGTVTVSAGFEG
ncbi:Peptidyl-tRNA hydrolase [Quadrisphaera granulorum]|uniref:Peptidyl-tRNA hydrolase n=1 Tax=Quadrisphaera granulorum TaxID=317664 RepID=A0A316A8K8_9ACTN|nr:peptidyl-tRNA hydrolase [Quadrisphaera granulorum]PWJ53528.1 peptidyl-tRNA hydrolase [Quadrisphaera granulorum]SZE96870.1 Peptidyl-tRNA hydrolase [Quadrisphaera granulorum]